MLDYPQLKNDSRIKITIGIHPKVVPQESTGKINQYMEELKERLSTQGNLVAIWECGVDVSQGNKNIDRQIKIFDEQLNIANQKKLPVIIHCRGGQNMMELCLHSLKSILDKNHRIHWHCFDGNVHNYHNIKQEFPNTKFGISPFLLMDEQHSDFRTKVCEMDLQDILMESDVFPYLLKDIIWKRASKFVPMVRK
jgi:TatD DNase family protein